MHGSLLQLLRQQVVQSSHLRRGIVLRDLKDLELTALQLDATLAQLHAVLGSTDVEYDFDLGKQIYEQKIEEGRILGQLSGDQSESDFASASEQGFRSVGWMGAVITWSIFQRALVETGSNDVLA